MLALRIATTTIAFDRVPERDIRVSVDLGIGKGSWTVWSCDLTHRYIDINGSYRS